MTISVRNPADGAVVGSVAIDTPEAVAAKARQLRLFQPEWEAMSAKGRKPWLLKFQDWILDNAEHITDLVQSETAKPRAEASIEPPLTADLLNYWARIRRGFPGRPTSEAAQPADEDQAADHRLPALSGRWLDHPVELPVPERRKRRDPGAGRRRRVAAEALGSDTVERSRIRPGMDGIGAPPVLTGQRVCGDRRRGDRQLRLRALHRFDGHRTQSGRGMCGAPDPVQPGTRWQGSRGGVGRRRPRARGERHRVGRDVQLRSGMRIRRTGLRRGAGL